MKAGQFSQLFAILLLFLMILGSVLFVFPMRGDVETLQVTEATLAEELVALETEYESLAALAEDVSTSEITKQSLMAAVPSGYAQDDLILELSDMASELGFPLNAVNFSDTVSQEFGNTITISASFSGTYEQLIAFLQKLETADRLLRVLSLNVQRTSTSDISFNISLEAYYQ